MLLIDNRSEEEHKPQTTCESKQIQADLTPPPTPPASSPPSPSIASSSPEALAREERRRKRDERRAARQQNEDKYKLDIPMLPEEYLEDRCKVFAFHYLVSHILTFTNYY
jgi:hypothetical protein